MTTTAPERDTARRANLRKADDIRIRQAALKRDINVGRLFADAILLGTSSLQDADLRAVERLTVYKLLDAMPYYGVTRTRKKLLALNIPENKRLQDMTEHQRRVLADSLRNRYNPRYTHRPWPQAGA
jgi:hypothetical protein